MGNVLGSCYPHGANSKGSFTRGFKAIADNFQSVEQVSDALRQHGLESGSLIVALDFTKSNEWTGLNTFSQRSLHWLGEEPNPYEQVISIIAKTLKSFNDGGSIPAIGFGDASTQDTSVFSFFANAAPVVGVEALVTRYRELVPHVKLGGPTSLAPAIYQAMKTVVDSGCKYHILLVVADGQVLDQRPETWQQPQTNQSQASSSQATQSGARTQMNRQYSISAIVAASELPLSIVMVGVGDGPFDDIKAFCDNLPDRRWDNFHFVNYTEISARHTEPNKREAAFALAALMGIPEQCKIISREGILGTALALETNVRCLPPPGPGQSPSLGQGLGMYIEAATSSRGAPAERAASQQIPAFEHRSAQSVGSSGGTASRSASTGAPRSIALGPLSSVLMPVSASSQGAPSMGLAGAVSGENLTPFDRCVTARAEAAGGSVEGQARPKHQSPFARWAESSTSVGTAGNILQGMQSSRGSEMLPHIIPRSSDPSVGAPSPFVTWASTERDFPQSSASHAAFHAAAPSAVLPTLPTVPAPVSRPQSQALASVATALPSAPMETMEIPEGPSCVMINGSMEEVDPLFICPLTHDLMKDPVMAADGHTYEREAITKWLQTHDTSPLTNKKLYRTDLQPDDGLRLEIQEFLEAFNG